MKFSIATPYGLKKTHIDFEVKRSKVKVINKQILSVKTLSFPHDISRTIWAIAMKFYITTPCGLIKTPIDFEVKRSKFKVVNLYILSVCNTIISGRYFKKILSLCNVILYQNSLGRLSPLSKCPAPFVLLVFIVLHVAIFSAGAWGELLRIKQVLGGLYVLITSIRTV